MFWIPQLLASVCVGLAVGSGLALALPYWDAFARRQLGSLIDRFARLRFERKHLNLILRLWLVSIVAVFLVLWIVFRMFPVAALTAVLCYLASWHVLAFLIERRERLLRDQLVGASLRLGNAATAGLSLAEGISSICPEVPEPLKSELQRIVFDFRAGRTLKESLQIARHALQLEPFTLFSLSLEASIERGGRVNEALERISHSLEENRTLERRIDSETATGRQVVFLLSIFPILFLAMFYFLDQEATSLLFSTLAGQWSLVATGCLVYAGVTWARSILRLEK